jgi:hypothetical protein
MSDVASFFQNNLVSQFVAFSVRNTIKQPGCFRGQERAAVHAAHHLQILVLTCECREFQVHSVAFACDCT